MKVISLRFLQFLMFVSTFALSLSWSSEILKYRVVHENLSLLRTVVHQASDFVEQFIFVSFVQRNKYHAEGKCDMFC